jgi:hypothetical protein
VAASSATFFIWFADAVSVRAAASSFSSVWLAFCSALLVVVGASALELALLQL